MAEGRDKEGKKVSTYRFNVGRSEPESSEDVVPVGAASGLPGDI